jgi:hypothetical protein
MAYTVKLSAKAQRQVEELQNTLGSESRARSDYWLKNPIADLPASLRDIQSFAVFTQAKIM